MQWGRGMTSSQPMGKALGNPRWGRGWPWFTLAWALVGCLWPNPSLATPIRPVTPCPDRLESLMDRMLRDLPSYANRVAARQLGQNASALGWGSLLVAGRAEFEPLPLGNAPLPPEVYQVFFTTLERQYSPGPQPGSQRTEQRYHWLFLTQGSQGWLLVFLFSQAEGDSFIPARDQTQGILGQAIALWLRDCRAGAVAPPTP